MTLSVSTSQTSVQGVASPVSRPVPSSLVLHLPKQNVWFLTNWSPREGQEQEQEEALREEVAAFGAAGARP